MTLGAVTVLMTASICLVELNGQRHLAIALERTGTASTVPRNRPQADMMHDTLRGDVLNALHAAATNDKDAHEESIRDMQEHVGNLCARIKDNEALGFDESVSKASQDVKPALDTYQQRAQSIVTIAFDQRSVAEAQYPAFLETFSVLEEAMGNLSDQINARVGTISNEAVATVERHCHAHTAHRGW
jgi:methyl-accepting chemotaxis protein